jgi:hypothetical protein
MVTGYVKMNNSKVTNIAIPTAHRSIVPPEFKMIFGEPHYKTGRRKIRMPKDQQIIEGFFARQIGDKGDKITYDTSIFRYHDEETRKQFGRAFESLKDVSWTVMIAWKNYDGSW